jgi:hypothetical protein
VEHLELAGELRDTERAITFWKQKASEFGRPPPATEFDFSWITNYGYRFVICADMLVKEDSVLFQFRRLIELAMPLQLLRCTDRVLPSC